MSTDSRATKDSRATEQHVYHHNYADGPRVNVKAERNSKSWNYEATVTNVASVMEAIALLEQATEALEKRYGRKSELELAQ